MTIPYDSATLAPSHIETTCKPGCGAATCSFLMRGPNGWECSKGSSFEPLILQRRAAGTLNAKGDNCSGPPAFQVGT